MLEGVATYAKECEKQCCSPTHVLAEGCLSYSIGFDFLLCETVDDAVSTWIHVPHNQGDGVGGNC